MPRKLHGPPDFYPLPWSIPPSCSTEKSPTPSRWAHSFAGKLPLPLGLRGIFEVWCKGPESKRNSLAPADFGLLYELTEVGP